MTKKKDLVFQMILFFIKQIIHYMKTVYIQMILTQLLNLCTIQIYHVVHLKLLVKVPY